MDYRARKLEEDPEAYRRHNADMMKKWRDKNKEHLSRWWTTNVNYRLKAIRDQAKKKGYMWADDMTRDVCATMMTSPCFYCLTKKEETVNGIDRLDNTKGYSVSNCVGCCKNCNFIKKCLDPQTFVNRCVHIASCHGYTSAALYPQSWPNTYPVAMSEYKSRAKKKHLSFDLTRDDYKRLINTPCHYCQREITETNLSGIDRVDNSLGYSLDNVVSCCSQCNQMRTNIPQNEFIQTCILVAQRAHLLEFSKDIVPCLRVITKRTVQNNNVTPE
jgi:hypothetical protein